jgi:hypothetical protein
MEKHLSAVRKGENQLSKEAFLHFEAIIEK